MRRADGRDAVRFGNEKPYDSDGPTGISGPDFLRFQYL